jgi:hypothetical protein
MERGHRVRLATVLPRVPYVALGFLRRLTRGAVIGRGETGNFSADQS